MNSYHAEYLILGAGISGMGAAWTLKKKEKDFLILEAGESAGGVLKSIQQNGYTLDLGANTAALNPEYRSFLESLGLSIEYPLQAGSRRFLWQTEGLVEVKNSMFSILRAPWLSTKAKVALLLEPFLRKGRSGEESVYDFISRRLHPEIAEKLVDPVLKGIYASDIKQLSSRTVLPALKEGEQKYGSLFRYLITNKPTFKRQIHGITGGFSTLNGAFERHYKEHLRLQTSVESVLPTATGWSVQCCKNGINLEYTCQHLIIALPAYGASQVLASAFPKLAAQLAAINYRPMGTLSIGFKESDCCKLPDSFGFLVPGYMNKKLLGVLFNSAVFAGKAPNGHRLYTVFHQETERDPQKLFSILSAELLEVGFSGSPVFLFAHSWPQAIPFMEVGYGHLIHSIHIEAQEAGIALCGNYLGQVSVGDSFVSGCTAIEKGIASNETIPSSISLLKSATESEFSDSRIVRSK